jgi:hypothetical protein
MKTVEKEIRANKIDPEDKKGGAVDEEIEKETSEDKFTRLAVTRVNAVLQKIRILSNLAGPSYRFDDAQVDKIFQNLRSEIDVVEGTFRNRGKKKTGFTL